MGICSLFASGPYYYVKYTWPSLLNYRSISDMKQVVPKQARRGCGDLMCYSQYQVALMVQASLVDTC